MEGNKQGIFEEYYEHMQQVLLQKIRESRKEINLPELAPELLQTLKKQLQQITLRTWIFEMEICEENGKLTGDTIQDRYECFVEVFLKNADYRKEIYEAYPVMHESIVRALGDFARNICELLDRFADDRDMINQKWYPGNPCGGIRQIGGGNSDNHRQGHRVLILDLDNGEKLVYKPRGLAIDAAYETFLRWVFENIGMPCWWHRVWDRGEYGWCQWVSSLSCSSRRELERYYYRNGVLLCVSYLLGSGDMHYENLIAHGEYPVIVDLEMAVGNHEIRTKEGLTYTERFYQESVLQTGILPLYTWNADGEGVNVGAINGKGGQLVPVVMPVVVNPGTVKMHIEYQRPQMGEGKNLATLHGKFIEPYKFLPQIQKGFAETYMLLAGQREKTMEMLGLFRDISARYLVRHTQQYYMLLMTLGHPDLLIRDSDRQPVWDVLERGMEPGEASEWIRSQEKQELLRGDVPCFYYSVDKKELRSGTGAVWSDYFDHTALQCVENRLERMCSEDMERQEKLICGALLIGTKGIYRQKPAYMGRTAKMSVQCAPYADEAGNKILAAEKIADSLLEEAIWSEDGKEAGWISIMMAGYREKSYFIRPMNFYLYGGLAGMAVFMAELADKVQTEKYRNVKNILTRQLFQHTEDLVQREVSERALTGAYAGEASVAFAYMLLYAISEDSVLLAYLRKQCQAVAKWLADDREFDVLGGNAGAILVFLDAYELTGEGQYMTWARQAGDCLLRSATAYDHGTGWVNQSLGVALTGFAHGTAGIMLALTRLGCDAQEDRYLEAAYQAYQYEEHYFREEIQDWEDLRNEGPVSVEHRRMAWCHGWGGIVMARMAALKYAKGNFKRELEKTVVFVRRKAGENCHERKEFLEESAISGTSLCLCHGICGNIALLWGIGERELAVRMQNRLIKTVCCQEADIREILELQECDNYGLFGGIAGIGYSCLCEPGKVLELLCAGLPGRTG